MTYAQACEKGKVKDTKRQARKWRNHYGAAATVAGISHRVRRSDTPRSAKRS